MKDNWVVEVRGIGTTLTWWALRALSRLLKQYRVVEVWRVGMTYLVGIARTQPATEAIQVGLKLPAGNRGGGG